MNDRCGAARQHVLEDEGLEGGKPALEHWKARDKCKRDRCHRHDGEQRGERKAARRARKADVAHTHGDARDETKRIQGGWRKNAASDRAGCADDWIHRRLSQNAIVSGWSVSWWLASATLPHATLEPHHDVITRAIRSRRSRRR